jgi:hypothetical protein
MDCDAMYRAGQARRSAKSAPKGGGYANGGRVGKAAYADGGKVDTSRSGSSIPAGMRDNGRGGVEPMPGGEVPRRKMGGRVGKKGC